MPGTTGASRIRAGAPLGSGGCIRKDSVPPALGDCSVPVAEAWQPRKQTRVDTCRSFVLGGSAEGGCSPGTGTQWGGRWAGLCPGARAELPPGPVHSSESPRCLAVRVLLHDSGGIGWD